jgi:hypothetical protein
MNDSDETVRIALTRHHDLSTLSHYITVALGPATPSCCPFGQLSLSWQMKPRGLCRRGAPCVPADNLPNNQPTTGSYIRPKPSLIASKLGTQIGTGTRRCVCLAEAKFSEFLMPTSEAPGCIGAAISFSTRTAFSSAVSVIKA